MINALVKRYEDDVDASLAAAELGLAREELTKSAADVDRKLKPLLRRLDQAVVPRDQFEAAFRDVAPEVADVSIVKVAASVEKPATPQAQPAGDLSLTSDKDVYTQGDRPIFSVTSSRDCFLTLTDIDDKGAGTVLLPNKFQQDNRIKAHNTVQFPATDAPFQYRMGDKGFETVVAVCSKDIVSVDGIVHDFSNANFTKVPDYTHSVARAIAVEPKASPAMTTAGKAAARVDREITRTAIKVEVR
jgi:hypothetical protein